MNQSTIVSGGLTISGATLVPAVNWALGGFHGPIPPEVPALIAGVVVAGVHALVNAFKARSEAKAAASAPISPAV